MPTMPKPIAERLLAFAPGKPVALIGGRDRATGRLVFPCPEDPQRFDIVTLPNLGSLWSWTIQRFRPKSPPYAGPEAFQPYAVGYVALGDAIIVEGRLTGIAFDALRIGMAMQLTVEPFTLADGETALTYGFTLVEGAA